MDIKSEAKHCSICSEVLSQEIPKGYEILHVVYRITVIWVEQSLHFPAGHLIHLKQYPTLRNIDSIPTKYLMQS